MTSVFKTEMITGLLSSPVIYIPSTDYKYIDDTLLDIIKPNGGAPSPLDIDIEDVFEFDQTRGVVFFETKESDPDSVSTNSPQEFLKNHLGAGDTPQISLIKNCGDLLASQPDVVTFITYISQLYENGALHPLSTVILAGPVPFGQRLPQQLISVAKIIELPIPTFEQIETMVASIPISKQVEYAEAEVRNEFAKNLQGLSLSDIRQILRSTLIRTGGRLSRQTIYLSLEEKKQIVKKSGVIEVIDTDESLDRVGGLENLIDEIKRKKVIFEHLSLALSGRAKVPIPKGLLIIGMPGCGKSMIAKSIASEFNVALLRLDVNRLMGKYVGESEENLRRALATAEAAHPCVLWIDEMEKAFAGTDSGSNDVIIRLMGHFLTWLQERKTAVYVVATANDTLKPELMRKGRFDDVFFVDFPNKKETESILGKTIERYSDATLYDWSEITVNARKELVDKMLKMAPHGFAGAEINSLVGTVVENAFLRYASTLNSGNSTPRTVKITKKDFEDVISQMSPFVMSRQLDKDKKESQTKTDSAISRIQKLQSEFKLRPASK